MDPGATEEEVFALNHVLCREARGALLFPRDGDRHRFSQSLERHLVDCSCRALGYCFELPYVHLLVEADGDGLDCLIARLSTELRSDCGRSPDALADAESLRWSVRRLEAPEEALLLLRYFHRSPVIRQVVSDPEGFRWSSHRAYLGDVYVPWLSTDPLLSLFGSLDDRSTLSRYRAFMARPVAHHLPAETDPGAAAWGRDFAYQGAGGVS